MPGNGCGGVALLSAVVWGMRELNLYSKHFYHPYLPSNWGGRLGIPETKARAPLSGVATMPSLFFDDGGVKVHFDLDYPTTNLRSVALLQGTM